MMMWMDICVIIMRREERRVERGEDRNEEEKI
jgi:hypothetical protein